MKLFLFALIVAPIADYFANDGKLLAAGLGYLASAAHTITNLGASVGPSMG